MIDSSKTSSSRIFVAARRRVSAFTLIEILVAMTLTAMLMIAVLSITASLHKSQGAWKSRFATPADANAAIHRVRAAALIQILTFDLDQAEATICIPNHVELRGYSSLDPSTLEPTHLPSRIIYEIDTSTRCMVRRQTLLTTANRIDPVWTELVCPKVGAFDLHEVFQKIAPIPAPLDAVDGIGSSVPGVPIRQPQGPFALRISWQDPRVADTLEIITIH